MKKILAGFMVIFIVIFSSTTALGKEITYSKVEFTADLKVLKELLENNHGNLYESIKKEKLDKLFKETEAKIDENMTIQEFYYEISRIISAIKDGHTSVGSSDHFINTIMERGTYLPLRVKFIDKKMYSDFINEYVPIGAEILEINGEKASDVVSKLKYISGSESSDNVALSHKIIEETLPFLYPQYFGEKTEHTIKFKDPKSNKIKTVLLKSEDIDIYKLEFFPYSNYIKNTYALEESPLKAEFDMKRNTAILRIYTFAPQDSEMFKEYIDKFFEDVKYKNIKNIVFDVRGNLGGDIYLLNYILAYVYNKDFYVIRNEKHPIPDLVRTDLLTKEGKEMFNAFKESLNYASEEDMGYQILKDGSYYYEEYKVEHMEKNNFRGNVYVLANEGSFSCGSIFPEKIQELKNGYFIGTEASGNYYETTAGIIPQWELPNTKIKVSIPFIQMVIQNKIDKHIPRNSGVKPDYEVKLKYDDYMKGIDTQMNFVYNLIKNRVNR